MISADKVLSEDQLNKLLRKLEQEKDKSILHILNSDNRNPNDVRTVVDFYLFSIIANTGLRVTEALTLKYTDLHEDFLIIRPEVSKNKKKGTVYFGAKTKKLLIEFIDLRMDLLKRVESDLIFSLTGKVLSRSLVHSRFKMWCRVVGLSSKLSVHSLRHTYGTLCLDKGLPLTFVRDNLRHSNISVTSQYLHLTQESRDKVKYLF